MIDLHLHSNASDGMLAPAALVRQAGEAGLTAIALTDHDTTAGVPEAMAEGERAGMEVVPGVEISLEHENTFHMIGLFVDEHRGLQEALDRIRVGRADRNLRLIARLSEMGMPLTMGDVEEHAGGEVVARPHFARALVAKGYVGTLKEAFDVYIGKGRPGYVDRYRLQAPEAIGHIHAAGGVSVLCHPKTLGLDLGDGDGGELLPFVRGLAEQGLDAMEVWYPDHDPLTADRLRGVARDALLLESGGSDYHGHSRKDTRAGVGTGGLKIPCSVLEALRERALSRRP